MVLTLVIHRQLTSLAENSGGLAQGLHKILPANFGGTLDKSRFSGNKSLQGKNDLRETVRADASAREFHVGGNSPLPPARRQPCFVSYFSSSMGEPGRKLRLLCVSGCTTSCRQNPGKPLINHICRVINPYCEENNNALDLETPYCFPNGRVPPERLCKRRPGQEWLICPKDFSGSRFNLVSQWISVTTAIDRVLAHIFHRQWVSLTKNPARLARKAHRIIPPKSAKTLDKGRSSGNKSLL
jgi:hypothetical protein